MYKASSNSTSDRPPRAQKMCQAPKQFYLPDLLPLCPLKDSTNPHYHKAAAESSAWIDSYNIFADRKRAFFIQCSNELLVSHTYPYAGYEQFRTCCDFVNLRSYSQSRFPTPESQHLELFQYLLSTKSAMIRAGRMPMPQARYFSTQCDTLKGKTIPSSAK